MNIYPNTQCAAYCAWILVNSNIRVTTARKIQIQTVQTAANTGGYVAQLYYEEFVAYTSQWYLQYQQYIDQQPQPIPSSLDALTTTWLAALSTTPAQQTIYSVDAFFRQLRADGNLAIDCMYLFAQDIQANANKSLFNTATFTAVPTGTPVWTANNGYQCNGSSNYIKTGFVPASSGTNYVTNSAMIGYYSRLSISAVFNIDMASYDGSYFAEGYSNWAGTGMSSLINGTTGITTANTQTQGLFVHNRNSSSNVQSWINGAMLAQGSTTATGKSTQQIYLGARNNNGTADGYTAQQYACAIVGAGSLNMVTLNSAVNLLMTNLGAHY